MKSYSICKKLTDWRSTEDLCSFDYLKKSPLLIKVTRDIKRYPKTNDRALLSQSAKVELRKQRINLILNELKK